MMWYQFSIPANYVNQKMIIRNLRTWIQNLESDELISGYSFNHYFSSETGTGTLKIRFDCSEENLELIKTGLSENLEALEITCELTEEEWRGQEHVRRAMEFGSRCAFLFFELLENGRFSEEYISNFLTEGNVPYQFQQCINHGLMNSLAIPKQPNELLIHLYLLNESIKNVFGVTLG